MGLEHIRRDFPILAKGIIYMDNAASSLTPKQVIDKMLEYYYEYRANVERGIHRLSQKASEEFEQAHAKVAEFINARDEAEVIFTKNATEGINLVANGLEWRKSDKIVTTLIEHHSNFITWLRISRKFGVEVEVVRPDPTGIFDLADFEKAIDDRTKLVAVTQLSNVLGCVVPVREIAKIAHEHGSLVLVDGAQSVPHMRVDVRELNCDFLAFSGHKMLGPTGIGVLYVRGELLEAVEPLCIGGGTIDSVDIGDYVLAKSPMRFEAGTPPIAEAIGLGAAVDYLKAIGMEEVEKHDRAITKAIYEGLKEIPKVELYGPEDPRDRLGIVSFNVGDLNPHDIALTLDTAANIVVRSGHHCAQPLMKYLLKRPDGTVRASTYIYNTLEEVEKLVATIEEIARSLA